MSIQPGAELWKDGHEAALGVTHSASSQVQHDDPAYVSANPKCASVAIHGHRESLGASLDTSPQLQH
jgi:hypothetical protein